MRLDSKGMDSRGEKWSDRQLHDPWRIPPDSGDGTCDGIHTYKYVTLRGKINVANRIKVTN